MQGKGWENVQKSIDNQTEHHHTMVSRDKFRKTLENRSIGFDKKIFGIDNFCVPPLEACRPQAI